MSIYFVSTQHPFFSNLKKCTGFGLVVLLSLIGLAVGCTSETAEGPGMPSSPGMTDNTIPPSTETSNISGPTNFSAMLLESVTEEPITMKPFTVRALDNQTGQPLPGFEAQTDSNAMVSFSDLPPGKVGFLVVGVINEAIDTYQFNLDSNSQGETLWLVAKSSVITAPTLANVILDPEKATAAGAIYWINAAGQEEKVGCATVRIDAEASDIRYFGSNALPTTNVAREDAPNMEVRTSTNPLNGKFYIANTTPGTHTITMSLNGQDMGSTTLMMFVSKESTDGEHSISISNIYVEGQNANPTPPDCI